MTPLHRQLTGLQWEAIRARLPLPLTREDACLDLSYLARAGMLVRYDRQRCQYQGLGARQLAARWGWEGDPGVQRAARLLRSIPMWADDGLWKLRVFQDWYERRSMLNG